LHCRCRETRTPVCSTIHSYKDNGSLFYFSKINTMIKLWFRQPPHCDHILRKWICTFISFSIFVSRQIFFHTHNLHQMQIEMEFGV
jgi:hypothetical protein